MMRQRTTKLRPYPVDEDDDEDEDCAVPIKRVAAEAASALHQHQNVPIPRARKSSLGSSPSPAPASGDEEREEEDDDDETAKEKALKRVTKALAKAQHEFGTPLPPMINPLTKTPPKKPRNNNPYAGHPPLRRQIAFDSPSLASTSPSTSTHNVSNTNNAEETGVSQMHLKFMHNKLLGNLAAMDGAIRKWYNQTKDFMPKSLYRLWNMQGAAGSHKAEALLELMGESEQLASRFLRCLATGVPYDLRTEIKNWQAAISVPKHQPQQQQQVFKPQPQQRLPGTFGEIDPELIRAVCRQSEFGFHQPQVSHHPPRSVNIQQQQNRPAQPPPPPTLPHQQQQVKITAVSPVTEEPHHNDAESLDNTVNEVLKCFKKARRSAVKEKVKKWFKAEAKDTADKTVKAESLLGLLTLLNCTSNDAKLAFTRALSSFGDELKPDAVTFTQVETVCYEALLPWADVSDVHEIKPSPNIKFVEPHPFDSDDEDDYDPYYNPMHFDYVDSDLEELAEEPTWRYMYSSDEEEADDDDDDDSEPNDVNQEETAKTEDEEEEKDEEDGCPVFPPDQYKDELRAEQREVIVSLRRFYTAASLQLIESPPRRICPPRKAKQLKRRSEDFVCSPQQHKYSAPVSVISDANLQCLFVALLDRSPPFAGPKSKTNKPVLPKEAGSGALRIWGELAVEETRTALRKACAVGSATRTNGGLLDLKASDWVAALSCGDSNLHSGSSLTVFLRPNPTDRKILFQVFRSLPYSKDLRKAWFDHACRGLQLYLAQVGVRKDLLDVMHPKRKEPSVNPPQTQPSVEAVTTYVTACKVTSLKTDPAGANITTVYAPGVITHTEDQVRQLCDGPQYTCSYFVKSAEQLLQRAVILWEFGGADGPLTSKHFIEAHEQMIRMMR